MKNEPEREAQADIKKIDREIKLNIESNISRAHKERMGQYFTPGNVIDMLLEILDPKPNEVIIDPSSGCGNILLHAHDYIYKKYRSVGQNINGIELDNSLIEYSNKFHKKLGLYSFIKCDDALRVNEFDDQIDVIIGNPPFGKIVDLKTSDYADQYFTTNKRDRHERIEILFLEKCIQMLKVGGRMGVIIPDGILGNKSSGLIRKWILSKGKILAVISLPAETFMPYTSVKTSALIFEKTISVLTDYRIFMAIADTCGHDRRGEENR